MKFINQNNINTQTKYFYTLYTDSARSTNYNHNYICNDWDRLMPPTCV